MVWNKFPVFSSSNIASISYENEQCILAVTFLNGSTYHYYEVPQHVSNDLQHAHSKGEALAEFVKGKYRYSKV